MSMFVYYYIVVIGLREMSCLLSEGGKKKQKTEHVGTDSISNKLQISVVGSQQRLQQQNNVNESEVLSSARGVLQG